MHDPRNDDLADVIVNHSLKLRKGENVLILGTGFSCEPLIASVLRTARAVGAHPVFRMDSQRLRRVWLAEGDGEAIDLAAEADTVLMKKMDAYVGIISPENAVELSDVPGENINLYQERYYKPVHLDIRVPDTRWVVLRYPTDSFAQSAGMSREAFEDFYYRVSSVDYGKMSSALEPLKELLDHTDRVRILGPGTDLSFRIAGIPAIPCAGEFNLPDGEIFTAPIRNSAEGVIRYNADSIHDGFRYSDVQFRFEKGRIVEATASDTERLNAALDIDKGARYLGEFALGVNPFVDRVVGDTLFDEKIRGSIHLTPGACYDEAPNGNDSALHWDLVLLQDAESGGGEIYFDDRLVRKDGRFVVPELEGLNPENLA